MICPHCGRTIQERDRYTMSADPDSPGLPEMWDDGEPWQQALLKLFCLVVLLLVVSTLIYAASHA